MKPKTKKAIILVAFILIVSVIGLYLGGILWPQKQVLISGNGRLEATEVDVSTKLAGRVVKILVGEGDFVQPGQLLVQMQIDTLQAQYDEAKAIVIQREAELDAAKRRLARTEQLAKEGASSLQELDDDRAAERVAQATLTAAKATVARIEADLADSSLKAPCEGRVQYKIAEEAEVLGAGGKVLNLMDLDDVYMTFFLPEREAGQVALGSEVRIVLDAAPEYVIPATVSYVASVAQFTPKTVETAKERQKLMFRVKAQVDPSLKQKYMKMVKTGLPGVAWLKLDPQAEWPKKLAVRLPEVN